MSLFLSEKTQHCTLFCSIKSVTYVTKTSKVTASTRYRGPLEPLKPHQYLTTRNNAALKHRLHHVHYASPTRFPAALPCPRLFCVCSLYIRSSRIKTTVAFLINRKATVVFENVLGLVFFYPIFDAILLLQILIHFNFFTMILMLNFIVFSRDRL